MQMFIKINRKVAFFIWNSRTKKSKYCCHKQRRKCSNEILPGVDLNSISGRIGRLVYFVSEFVCRDFIGRCRCLVFVIARFFKSMT